MNDVAACKNCKYFSANKKQSCTGFCRFNPPVVIGDTKLYKSVWPQVNEMDFCSKYDSYSNSYLDHVKD